MKSNMTTVLCTITALLVLSWMTPGAAAPLQHAPPRIEKAATAAGTARLTIPAAAFTPFQGEYDYRNDGRFITHLHGPGGSVDNGQYYAAVHLPQGAVITRMVFNWYDVTNGANALAMIKMQMFDSDVDYNWGFASSGAGGYGSSSSSSVISTPIDNLQNMYWLVLDLPATEDVKGCAITLEYTPPAVSSGIMTIPAADFTPFEDGYQYRNDGKSIWTKAGVSGDYGWYIAPLELPQDAVVTKMTFHWYDATSTAKVLARLQRTDFTLGNFQEMAYAESTGFGGYGSSSDSTITFPNIDNAQHSYWVVWDMGVGTSLKGCGVVIEYTLPATNVNRISIPAAAFKPFEDGYDFENDARFLKHLHSPGGGTANGWYMAQVNLPQGATVSGMNFSWYNQALVNATAKLQRTTLGEGNYQNIGVVNTSPLSGNSNQWADQIDYGVVDNSRYAYWLVWDTPATPNVLGYGIVLEYNYRISLPLVMQNGN